MGASVNPKQPSKVSPLAVTLLAFVVALFAGSSANATLGEHSSTVDRDRGAMGTGRVRVVTGEAYNVHETSSEGTTIREFADLHGTIFAVSWEGIKKPDLSVLLGRFHDEFSTLEASQPRMLSRAPRLFRTSQVVVEKGGTFRNKRGRAYIPGLLPDGVSPNDL